jgi:transcriptional regulator with XRE-family HTH domain
MDRSFYVELETAVHSVTVDRLAEIADALEVTLAELFTDRVFYAHPG